MTDVREKLKNYITAVRRISNLCLKSAVFQSKTAL